MKKYDYEKMKLDAKKELVETNKNIYKKVKKLLLIASVIIVVVLILTRLFGPIELYNPLGNPSSKARYYKVLINGEQIPVHYELDHKITIIPYVLYLNNYYLGNSYVAGNDSTSFVDDGSKEYIIDISSYSCFYNNYQVECTKNIQKMKEDNDTKYTNMKITRTSNKYEVVYDGKVLDDIYPYLDIEGVYHVEITAKYKNNTSKVYFYFEKN